MPDLPVAAPDPAECPHVSHGVFTLCEAERRKRAAATIRSVNDLLRSLGNKKAADHADAALDALLAERQQDKELRERVEKIAAEPCKWVEQGDIPCPDEWPLAREEWCRSCIARDVLVPPIPFYGGIPQGGPPALAVKEDAQPGKPETPGNSGAAVEKDAAP